MEEIGRAGKEGKLVTQEMDMVVTSRPAASRKFIAIACMVIHRKSRRGQFMKEEIQTPIQTYQRSLNEAKLHLVSAVYADDAMFIGQPFPKATGIEKIVATYPNAFSKLNFDVQFDIQEIEPNGDLRFIRTQSHGTIVPKGENSKRSEGNREIFVVKKIKVSGSSTGKSSMPSSGGPSAF